MFVGIDNYIHGVPFKKIDKYTPPSWYKHFVEWTYHCNKNEEQIDIVDAFEKIQLLRHNNLEIMNKFIKVADKNDLKILNYMQLSIQAITLSDITNPDSNYITEDAFKLNRGNNLRTKHDWPRCPPSFTPNQIKLWKTTL